LTINYGWSTSSSTAPTEWKTETMTGAAGRTTLSSVNVTLNGVTGTYYLWVKSGLTDAAGNATTANYVSSSVVFNMDNTAPDVSGIIISPSTTNPTNQDITITISGWPADAAVKQYKIDSGSWTAYSAAFTVSTNCTIYVRAADSAGNYSSDSGKSLTISNIDKTAPANATISLTGTSMTTAGSVNATVTHTDTGGSGVNISSSKWILNTSSSLIGTEASSYEKVFSTNPETITLTASNPETYYLHVLTVDKAGNATETISSGITVTQLVTGISLNSTTLTLNRTTSNPTSTLTATITPTNASNKNVTWSSNNTAVATVSTAGVVTGISAGTATITCTAADGSGKTATCSVTVNQLVTGITLSKTSTTITAGNTETITTTIAPTNATNQNVTWSSSNTAVATVSGGTITAVAEGTVTITCTANDGSGISSTCAVTVERKVETVADLKVGEYVAYTPTSQSYTMTTTQTGYTSSQSYTTSSYTGGWQVLYNDATNGVQLISSDVVGTLYLSGVNGYNNLVGTLNTMAGKYVDSTYAVSGRSVGSLPTDIETSAGTTNLYTDTTYDYMTTYGWNNKYKVADTNYTTDQTAMTSAGVINATTRYWLASRYIQAISSSTRFHSRWVEVNSLVGSDFLWYVSSGGPTSTYSYSNGVRPVITLKSDIQINKSDSTKDGTTQGNAWELIAPPNEPDLASDMTPVYWDTSGNEITTTSSDTNWYNYANNQWANAKTSDGSYWVWIPRYEYKIDSSNVGTDYTKAGTIDVNFISTLTTTASTGYTIHPAFTTDIANGGWSSQLSGIWVAKYEMSMETNGTATTTSSATIGKVATSSTVKMVSKPRSKQLEIYKYS